MHEYSLVDALFDQADAAIAPHAPSSVRAVTLRVGALAGVEPHLLRTAFETCRAERGYVRAALVVVEVAAAWRCAGCGADIAAEGPLRCSACGGDARLVEGAELVLQRLELEVPDV